MSSLPLVGNEFVIGLAMADVPPSVVPPEVGWDEQASATFDRFLAQAVAKVNDSYFRFELTELHDPGGPTFVDVLPADAGQRLDGFHIDDVHSTRKVTVLVTPVSVQGSLLLPLAGKDRALQPRSVYFFPSYLEAVVRVAEPARVWITFGCGPSYT